MLRYALVIACTMNASFLCAMDNPNPDAKQFFTGEHWEAFFRPLTLYFQNLAQCTQEHAQEEMQKLQAQLWQREEFQNAARGFDETQKQSADFFKTVAFFVQAIANEITSDKHEARDYYDL